MVYSSEAKEPVTLVKEVTVSAAAGTHAINVFKLCGSVRIIEQVAEITEVTTLTNCTAVYATLYDGTNTVNLTANGAVLSGCPVGTIFTRDQDSSNAYSVSKADECRLNETTNNRQVGLPFTVTQKNGADTYIRLHLTTTDDPISFKILIKFKYEAVDGGCLVWEV